MEDLLYRDTVQDGEFFVDLTVSEDDLPSEGWHTIHIDKVELKKSKKGEDMLNFKGTFEDGIITFWVAMLQGKGKPMARKFFRQVGAPISGGIREIVAFFQDTFVRGYVQHAYDDEGDLTYNITKWEQYEAFGPSSLEV